MTRINTSAQIRVVRVIRVAINPTQENPRKSAPIRVIRVAINSTGKIRVNPLPSA
jgi:hypothetical protein